MTQNHRTPIIHVMGVLALMALIALLAAGCTKIVGLPGPSQGTGTAGVIELGTYEEPELFDPEQDIRTKRFKSIDDFRAFIQRSEGSTDYAYAGIRSFAGADMVMALAEAADVDASRQAESVPAYPRDYSETNVQVTGIDEADIIKTDGSYIYTVTGNTVYIIKAYPGEDAEIVATIKRESSPQGLFVNGKYLAVFGSFNDLDFFRKIDFRPLFGMTYFDIYDISDREQPELMKEYKFEGNYFQSRMIDDWVYFVTSTQFQYRPDYPTPVIIEDAAVRTMPVTDIFYFEIPYQNPQLATVHAIRITDPDEDISSASVAVEQSQNMHMSFNNIYITYREYISEWQLRQKFMAQYMEQYLTDADRAVIEKIKKADNDILSFGEKQSKIMQIAFSYQSYMDEDERNSMEEWVNRQVRERLEEYEYLEWTVINRISVDEDDIRVEANGKVPGSIINQFSLDEYDDVLRVATTISMQWMPRWLFADDEEKAQPRWQESQNTVFTLDQDLDVIDSLMGLAEGERIFSTRFIKDKLYMVTFRQVDPFFVIDLSNPRSIKELGELKIPGFSRYLHPYDDDTIIGIGRDASEAGRQQGLKVSLFDVSDVYNPKEIAKFVAGERLARSTAEYEHRAFLFSREKNLLVIPAYSREYQSGEGYVESYNGAMVFHITKNDIELRGIVDHSTGSESRYRALVERSLYIEELLYTKSPGLLRINEIEDLESVKRIELKEAADSPYPVY